MNIELISMLIFFAVLGFFLYKNRGKYEFHSGLIILRWKRGLELIDTLIKNHEKAVRITGYVAVVIGFLGGLIGLGLIIFTVTKMTPGVALVLPTAAGYQYPGPIIGVPFWYWLIAIFIIMFAHETMHGVFARAGKVPLKNYGVLLFFVLPIGAFVDPDNKKVKKMKTSDKLSFFAAGSFANFIVGFLFLLLGLIFYALLMNPTIFAALTEPQGVDFNQTIEGYPAYESNLTGMIKTINGIEIKTYEDLSRTLNNTPIGENIEIVTNVSTYTLKTVAKLDNQTGSFIGIVSPMTIMGLKSGALITFNLLGWLFLLNIGIGVANLLPWKPFDGGLMAEEVLTKSFKKNGKLIANIITGLVYAIILFSLFGVRIIQAIF